MEKLYSCRKCGLCCLLVLFVILSTEAGGTRYVGPSFVEEGDPFEIECRVSEFDAIKWTVDGARIPGDVKSSIKPAGPGQVVSVLRVADAKSEHSGEYRCSAFLGPGHRIVVHGVSKIQCDYDFGTYKVFDYKTHLVLQCNLTFDAGEDSAAVSWLKNDKPVPTNEDRIKAEVKNNVYSLTTSFAVDADAGNYTIVVKASATGAEQRADITAVLKPLVKTPANVNVVEGEKLLITCNVFGVPVPKIQWIVGNTTYVQSTSRVTLSKDKEKGVANAVFQIEAANMDDRETYICQAETQVGSTVFNATSGTFVRIKDKMAALWPFLGICLEVVVLCTVILVYEKKRNKTEMEESDTDGSPEQKNTPDHGKDSDVRHRK